ncbi:hypothetical protein Gotur_024531, partial [Gossypium turneri]
KEFLDKVEDNAAVRYGPRQYSKRRVIVLQRGGFGTYCGRVHGFAPLPENSNKQGLSQSCQRPNVLKKADEHHGNERTVGCKSSRKVIVSAFLREI